MTLPVFPSNTRETIEQIIDMIGRDVTFYIVDTLSGCNLCTLDPISNTSTDSFCPTCSGEYWIPIYSGWTVKSHVTWGRSEDKAWMTGGIIDDGTATVKFMHTPEAEEIVHSAEWVVVEDREMDVDGITLRGVPEVNRIIVKVKEKER